jgi:hypothetical protein
MSNFEESAKAIESDYRFAPVGMAVGAFWGGALVAGLTAFVMSTGIARGFVPTKIVDNQRVIFANDYVGLYDGIAIAVVLFIASLLLGVAAKGAVNRKANLGGLWKLMLLIPALTFVFTVGVIVVKH